MRFEHACIMVNDLEKSINFYTKVFGFKILRKTARPHAFLYLGRDTLEIIPDKEINQKTPRPLFHLAFYTNKPLEKEVKRLNKMGIKTRPIVTTTFQQAQIVQMSEPPPTDPKLLGVMKPGTKDPKKAWKWISFKDPDGIMIEICERR